MCPPITSVGALGLAVALLGLLAPAAVVVAAPPTATWPMTWGDEFSGASLDATKWKWGSLPWGGQHHNDEYASWITAADSFVSNGSLWLRCRKAAGDEFGGYPYSEGACVRARMRKTSAAMVVAC